MAIMKSHLLVTTTGLKWLTFPFKKQISIREKNYGSLETYQDE